MRKSLPACTGKLTEAAIGSVYEPSTYSIQIGEENSRSEHRAAIGLGGLGHQHVLASPGNSDLASGPGKPVRECRFHLHQHRIRLFWHRWRSDCLSTPQQHVWLDLYLRGHMDRDLWYK